MAPEAYPPETYNRVATGEHADSSAAHLLSASPREPSGAAGSSPRVSTPKRPIIRPAILVIGAVLLLSAGMFRLFWAKVGNTPELAQESAEPIPSAISPISPEELAGLGPLHREAVALADRLLADYPGDPQAMFVRGLILNKFLSRDRAVACWLECIRIAPEMAEPYYWIGFDLFKRGSYREAMERLKKSIELGVAISDVRVVLGEAWINLGQPREAVTVLEEQIARYPQHAAGYFYLGHAYWLLGELDRAEELFTRVTELSPNNYQAWHSLAKIAQKKGDHNRAETYFARCKVLQTAFHEGHQEKRRQYDDIESLETSLASAYTDSGRIYLGKGNLEQAERDWRRAAEVDSKHVECRLLLADLFVLRKDLSALGSVIEELCQLEPGNPTHLMNRAALRANLGRFQESESDYLQVCQLAPDRAEGLMGLIELYLQFGRSPEKAVQLAEKLVRSHPEAASYHLLARSYWAAGQHRKAIEAAARAAELDPGDSRYAAFHQRLVQLEFSGGTPLE